MLWMSYQNSSLYYLSHNCPASISDLTSINWASLVAQW